MKVVAIRTDNDSQDVKVGGQAATKYFSGLEDGEVPLNLLFGGSIFYRDADGALQVTQIPWHKEAPYRLPVKTWRRAGVDHARGWYDFAVP